jgi:hypothetical protein
MQFPVEEHKMKRQLTAIIEREGNGYVALCPELDIANQGDTVQEGAGKPPGGLGTLF